MQYYTCRLIFLYTTTAHQENIITIMNNIAFLSKNMSIILFTEPNKNIDNVNQLKLKIIPIVAYILQFSTSLLS